MPWMSWTNAVPMDAMPKHSEIRGMNHPGPSHLQQMLDGIYLASVTIRQDGLYDSFVHPGGTHLKDDVADVEHGQDLVVVVALQLQVLLQTRETSIANVRSVDEAEQVQQGNGGDNIEIDLPPQLGLCLGIKGEERIAVARADQFVFDVS